MDHICVGDGGLATFGLRALCDFPLAVSSLGI